MKGILYIWFTLSIFIVISCKNDNKNISFGRASKGLKLDWGQEVFNFTHIGNAGDTSIYAFEYNSWVADTSLLPVEIPIFIPDGKLFIHDSIGYLISDSCYEHLGNTRLKLFDFNMEIGQKSSFAVSDSISYVAELILDGVIPIDTITYYKFRIKDYNINGSDWVYYLNYERGFLGTYVSCINDSIEHITSYYGVLPDILPNQLREPKKNYHGYGCN